MSSTDPVWLVRAPFSLSSNELKCLDGSIGDSLSCGISLEDKGTRYLSAFDDFLFGEGFAVDGGHVGEEDIAALRGCGGRDEPFRGVCEGEGDEGR